MTNRGSRPPAERPRPGVARVIRRVVVTAVALVAAVTVASFGYNLTSGDPVSRPPGLTMIKAGGFDTRYRTWGSAGSPIILIPGAFETADTFAALGAALGADHRVFAIDLTGTGYSQASPPFSAGHLAAQVLAFVRAEHLTGRDAPVLAGHSSGAAVAGMAALGGGHAIAGVIFLDGDALPLPGAAFAGHLLIDPYRTSLLRLALSSSWLIRRIYTSQCGPACPQLTAAGVETWRRPLQQPGFAAAISYTMQHGIPAMTTAQLARLKASPLPKRVIYGANDPQMTPADATPAASRIGAPAPVDVPGRHLTMISSPGPLAAAIRAFTASVRP